MLLRWCIRIGVSLVILAAIFFTTMRLLMPRFASQSYLQQLASHVLKTPVTIKKTTADWSRFRPIFILQGVTIYSHQSHLPIIKLNNITVKVNLLSSLVNVLSHIGKGTHAFSRVNGEFYVAINDMNEKNYQAAIELVPKLADLHIQQLSASLKLWGYLSAGGLSSLDGQYNIQTFQMPNISIQNMQGDTQWRGNMQSGQVSSDDFLSEINLPSLYAHPINLGHLSVVLKWKKQSTGWMVDVKNLLINNNNLNLNTAFKIQKSIADTYRTIDLLASFSLKDVSKIKYYVPTKITKPHLNLWLQQAFLAGSLDNGVLMMRGPIKPGFDLNHQGQFEVKANLHALKLSYAPHWPTTDHTEVSFWMHDRSIKLTSKQADVLGNPIDKIDASIDNVKKPLFNLTLHSLSTLDKGKEVINQSPLPLAQELAPLSLSGPMDLSLSLSIPLHHKPGIKPPVKTQGTLATSGGVLSMPQWNLTLDQLNGKLNFTNGDLSADTFKGNLFNRPAQINVTTTHQKGVRAIHVNVLGKMKPDEVAQHFSVPLIQFFSGKSLFSAALVLHDTKSNLGSNLHIHTNLFGIKTTDIPVPFAKSVLSKRALDIYLTIRKDKPVYFRVNYDNLVSSAMIYRHAANDGHQLSFMSGNIQLGSEQAQYLTAPGLVINGNLSLLRLEDWELFLNRLLNNASGDNKSHTIPVRSINLSANTLYVYNYTFANMLLHLAPKKTGWLVGVRNKKMNGTVLIPKDKHQTWIFNFKYLQLPKNIMSSVGSNQALIDPSILPPLDISIRNFSYGDKLLGAAYLQTQPIVSGLKIKQFDLTAKDYDINTAGWWKDSNKKERTLIVGKFNTKNLGNFVSLFEAKPTISNGEGSANFTFWWEGAPYHLDWKTLLGTLRLNFKNGSIVNIGKQSKAEIGLGRILNLLSLSSLTRRLTLNFNDLTHSGVWFDSFDGIWSIKDGLALTNSIQFEGPIVKIKAAGQLDLVHHASDLYLYVYPKLTSSAPLVAGLIGGPIAGAVTWVANKIIGPEINKASASAYHVQGSWTKPSIKKLTNGVSAHLAPVERRVKIDE